MTYKVLGKKRYLCKAGVGVIENDFDILVRDRIEEYTSTGGKDVDESYTFLH